MTMLDIATLEDEARKVLDPGAYDYIVGGADDELTVLDNVSAWSRLRLLPHVLRDVSEVSTDVSLYGANLSSPVFVAPCAYQRLVHEDGESEMARAAARAGSLMCVSTMATVSLEDVADASGGAPLWFQLYVHRDRDLTADLVLRAEAAGYQAMVFTVDVAVLGRRKRDERNSFSLPPGLEMANMRAAVPVGEGSGLDAYADSSFDSSINFEDIGWLRGITDLPVIVKGIVRADDADAAIRAGAQGIVVSNHGGRQLDTTVAAADALGPVVSAVAGRVPVLADGGIRSGSDVLKALALGADAVLVGRPLLWALATGGADLAAALMDQMRDELRRAMALCGAATLGALQEDLVLAPRDD
ncbi:MAG: alpha-hydroxy acid oxidase [Acidimicrobiia bacterium]